MYISPRVLNYNKHLRVIVSSSVTLATLTRDTDPFSALDARHACDTDSRGQYGAWVTPRTQIYIYFLFFHSPCNEEVLNLMELVHMIRKK